MRVRPAVCAYLLIAFACVPAAAKTSRATGPPAPTRVSFLAPADAFRIPLENVDGALLLSSTLYSTGDLDTTGLLVLDTGAGYLALAPGLIRSLQLSAGPVAPMTFASKPIRRIVLGSYSQDVVGPILSVDTEVIEQATDRKVLGLLGYEPLASFALRIDYRVDTLALIPIRRDGIEAAPSRRMTAADFAAGNASFLMARNASREALGTALESGATPIPFEIEGDGKILVTARLTSTRSERSEPLTLVLDTGATKSVLFRPAFERARGARAWPELHGLSAPTLYGTENAYMARVPVLAVSGAGETATATDVDVAVMESDLQSALSQATHRDIDGLLGYSFLRRFRLTIDYPHRILWLEAVPVGRDQRHYEYSHVGVQIERRDGALRIVAVAAESPAAAAGIRPGDEIAGIGAARAETLDVLEASRLLEGPPGTRVLLRIRRNAALRSYRLTRRVLL